MKYLLSIAFRNIFRNTRRSLLCIIAVAIAVFLIVFFMAYIEGMMDSLKVIATTFDSGHIKITTKDFQDKETFLPLQYPINNKDEIYEKIDKISGIKHITDRITTFVTFTSSKVKHGTVAGVNIDDIINSEKSQIKYGFYNFTKRDNGLLAGRYSENNRNECAVGYRLAKKMEIVWPILERYEFEWILENLDEKRGELFKKSYTYDSFLNVYKLSLFQNNQKVSKKEFKRIHKSEKEQYLNIFDSIINLNITKLPNKIEKDSKILEQVMLYSEDLFLNFYNYNEKDKIYEKKMSYDNEELLTFFQDAVTLRVQFKVVSSQYSDKYFAPKVVGIFEYDYITYDESLVIMPIERIKKATGLIDKAQNIYIFVDKAEDAPKIRKIVERSLNDSFLVVKDWTQFPFIAMFKQFEFLYVIIYAVFLIVASFLIVNTVLMTIHERIKEIGMMGALGMKRYEIVFVFFLEALLLSLFGSLLGVIVGGGSTFLLSFMPISMEAVTGGVEFPTTNTIFIKFSFLILINSFIFGVLVSSLCTIIPSIKSAFIEPVEALRR